VELKRVKAPLKTRLPPLPLTLPLTAWLLLEKVGPTHTNWYPPHVNAPVANANGVPTRLPVITAYTFPLLSAADAKGNMYVVPLGESVAKRGLSVRRLDSLRFDVFHRDKTVVNRTFVHVVKVSGALLLNG